MSFENISRLADLTGRSRATVVKLLAPLTPVIEGKAHLYETRDALPLIYEIDTGGAANFDLTAERARLAFHQANEKELQVKQLQGDLIPADAVLEEWQKMLSSMRSKLLSIPGKTAHLVIAAEKYQEAERILRVQIHEALMELSGSGLPAEHQKRLEGDHE